MKKLLKLSLMLIFLSLNAYTQEELVNRLQNPETRTDPEASLSNLNHDPGFYTENSIVLQLEPDINPTLSVSRGEAIDSPSQPLTFIEVICPNNIVVCCTEPTFEITGAQPASGTYYLNGDPITEFTPDCDNTGDFEIKFVFFSPFSIFTDSCYFDITVLPIPELTCPDDFSVCCDAGPIELSGATPEGGTYLLDGSPLTEFVPDCNNLGDFEITYLYVDAATGCENSCTFQIEVAPGPIVNAGEDATICQDESGYQLSGQVENATGFFWYSVLGSGTFDDEFALDAIYTPSIADYFIGTVEI